MQWWCVGLLPFVAPAVVESPPVFWDQALCLLELTWMLPRSLLRYHEKFHSSNVVSLCCSCCCTRLLSVGKSFRLTSGSSLTQGLLIHSVEVRSVALNTAPQFVDLMVSTLDKKRLLKLCTSRWLIVRAVGAAAVVSSASLLF